MPRVFLHDEMAAILDGRGNAWTTASEMAALVNGRGIYEMTPRAEASRVTTSQIRTRARLKPHMFERRGNPVRLRRKIAPDGGREDRGE